MVGGLWCVRGSDGRWQRSMGGTALPRLPARPAATTPSQRQTKPRESADALHHQPHHLLIVVDGVGVEEGHFLSGVTLPVGVAEDGGAEGDPGGGDRPRLCDPEHGEAPHKEQVGKLVETL